MEISPQTNKRKVGYPALVVAAVALASCQQESPQPLGGVVAPPPQTQTKSTPKPKTQQPKTDTPSREGQRVLGKCDSATFYNR